MSKEDNTSIERFLYDTKEERAGLRDILIENTGTIYPTIFDVHFRGGWLMSGSYSPSYNVGDRAIPLENYFGTCAYPAVIDRLVQTRGLLRQNAYPETLEGYFRRCDSFRWRCYFSDIWVLGGTPMSIDPILIPRLMEVARHRVVYALYQPTWFEGIGATEPPTHSKARGEIARLSDTYETISHSVGKYDITCVYRGE